MRELKLPLKPALRSGLRNESGMTLIEILAVIVLIGLIMSVVARGVFSQAESAKAQANLVRMQKVKGAIEQYRLQFSRYPSALQDLVKPSSDIQRDQLFTPFADSSDLKDVWNNDYLYRVENNGRSYALSCLGSDGVSGGDGAKSDIVLGP